MSGLTVPGASNPFSVNVQVGSAASPMGLVEAKESEYSTLNQMKQLGAVSAEYNKAQDEWDKQVNQTRVQDFANQLEAERLNLRDDPENGYANQLGSNALEGHGENGLLGEVSEKFRAKYDELYKRTSNPIIRRQLESLYQAQNLKLTQDVNRHIVKQQAAHTASVDQRTVDIAYLKAVSDDPEEQQSGMFVLRAFAKKFADKNGVAVDYPKFLGAAHSENLSRMLDSDDFRSAKAYLEQNKNEMTAAQVSRAKHSIRSAKSRVEKKAQTNRIAADYESLFSQQAIGANTIREFTGQKLSDAQWQEAQTLAGGDMERAVIIGSVGVSAYKAAEAKADSNNGDPLDYLDKGKRLTALRAVQEFRKRGEKITNGTVTDVYEAMRKANTDAPDDVIVDAAKKVVLARTKQMKMKDAETNQSALIGYNMITSGSASYDDIPASIKESMPEYVKEGLKKYSDRKAFRPDSPDGQRLETNNTLYYELKDNDDKLKGLSDAQFYSMAGEFDLQAFEVLRARREALKAGKVQKVNGQDAHNLVKQAFFELGIEMPKSETNKAIFGMVERLIEDNLIETMRDQNGKPLSEGDAVKQVSAMLQREFSITGRLFGGFFGDNKKTLVKVLKGGLLETPSSLDVVLNAGLQSLGINNPTDRNRTNALLFMELNPKRPIDGADAMAEAISTNHSEHYKKIEQDFLKIKGRKPTPNEIVRTYISGVMKVSK